MTGRSGGLPASYRTHRGRGSSINQELQPISQTWHHRRLGGSLRTIYAAQFQLEATGTDGAALEATVGRFAEDWVSRFYPERVALPLGGGELAPQQDHSVRIEVTPPDGPHRHWSLRWQRPSDAHPVGWESVLTLAQAGPLAELSCVVRTQLARKPSSSHLRRPGVIRSAVEELRCSASGLPLRAVAEPLSAARIPEFVARVLCSPERTLPVLVISGDELGDDPPVAPGVLEDRLVGLTHLVLLEDKWAAFALADAVGTDRSCCDGALRLYLPGFSLQADPSAHPLYPPPAPAKASLLPDVILQRLASDASARFQTGSITRAVREALGVPVAPPPAPAKAARSRRVEPLGDPPRPAEPDQALFDRIVAENEALARRNAALEHETLELELALEESRGAVTALMHKLDATKLALAGRPVGADARPGDEPELTCVLDAVGLARVRFAERLLFLASADASAAASPFQNARRAFEALKAVDEVAQLRRASIQDRTSVGSMENLFQNRGFLYKAHESMTARGRWGEEYQVVFEGRKESIEEHVAIGTGGPESCLRIHFFWDAASMRFVVAHVGRHKTNTRS